MYCCDAETSLVDVLYTNYGSRNVDRKPLYHLYERYNIMCVCLGCISRKNKMKENLEHITYASKTLYFS